MFLPQTNLLEIVLRVLLIYAALFALLRLVGRRELADLTPMDLITVLLLSETVSPALTSGDSSIATALVAAATLLALTWLLSWGTFRWPRLGRLIEGRPRLLVFDGRVDRSVLRRLHITRAELRGAMRQEGIGELAKVRWAVVEPTGKISFVRTEGD